MLRLSHELSYPAAQLFAYAPRKTEDHPLEQVGDGAPLLGAQATEDTLANDKDRAHLGEPHAWARLGQIVDEVPELEGLGSVVAAGDVNGIGMCARIIARIGRVPRLHLKQEVTGPAFSGVTHMSRQRTDVQPRARARDSIRPDIGFPWWVGSICR
jgi:hypothetical protein